MKQSGFAAQIDFENELDVLEEQKTAAQQWRHWKKPFSFSQELKSLVLNIANWTIY